MLESIYPLKFTTQKHLNGQNLTLYKDLDMALGFSKTLCMFMEVLS